jgi:hypothetical protein
MNFTYDKYSTPRTIEKMKSWEPFWSYQLISTANLAHLPQKDLGQKMTPVKVQDVLIKSKSNQVPKMVPSSYFLILE